MPHEAHDPVLAAAHIVTALQQVVARNVHPLQAAVVTVGRIRGGDAFNIIPEVVEMDGTMRSFDPGVWESLPEHFERVVSNTAAACGCSAEIRLERMMRPTVNDRSMAAIVREVAKEVVGEENVVSEQTMGGEDFSEVLARVPGCYFFVGSRNEAEGKVHPHHSPYFDIDERALPIGARILTEVALRYLERA